MHAAVLIIIALVAGGILTVALPLSNVFQISYAQGNSILINEVESNPPGNDNLTSVYEWIELYNPNDYAIDVSGWSVSSTAGRTATLLIDGGTVIPAGGYLVIASGSQWLDNSGEIVILADASGNQVDAVGPFSDDENDSRSWQRYPNGSEEWSFRPSTSESSNGGSIPEPTPEPNSDPISNAGPDFPVDEGETVFLDGSSSFDPDSDPLSYSWRQVSGPSVPISASNSDIASFVAPRVISFST